LGVVCIIWHLIEDGAGVSNVRVTYNNEMIYRIRSGCVCVALARGGEWDKVTNSVILRRIGSVSASRGSPKQPRDIFVHDERHARPWQDSNEVGPKATVERSYAPFGVCPCDARGDIGI